MAGIDRPLDRSTTSCFVCTGMGLGVSDDPDLRRFTLKGIAEDGERVEIASLIRTTHVSEVFVRVNLIGRWVCVTTDDRGEAFRLTYSEESAIEPEEPPISGWRSVFEGPDEPNDSSEA